MVILFREVGGDRAVPIQGLIPGVSPLQAFDFAFRRPDHPRGGGRLTGRCAG